MDKDLKHEVAGMILSSVPRMFFKFVKDSFQGSLNIQQFHLLLALKYYVRKPMSFFCEKLGQSKANLSIMVDKLVQDDLIERHFEENDRRIIYLVITEKGKQVADENLESTINVIANKIDDLSEAEMEQVLSHFMKLMEMLKLGNINCDFKNYENKELDNEKI